MAGGVIVISDICPSLCLLRHACETEYMHSCHKWIWMMIIMISVWKWKDFSSHTNVWGLVCNSLSYFPTHKNSNVSRTTLQQLKMGAAAHVCHLCVNIYKQSIHILSLFTCSILWNFINVYSQLFLWHFCIQQFDPWQFICVDWVLRLFANLLLRKQSGYRISQVTSCTNRLKWLYIYNLWVCVHMWYTCDILTHSCLSYYHVFYCWPLPVMIQICNLESVDCWSIWMFFKRMYRSFLTNVHLVHSKYMLFVVCLWLSTGQF